jgi:hypothetical protein
MWAIFGCFLHVHHNSRNISLNTTTANTFTCRQSLQKMDKLNEDRIEESYNEGELLSDDDFECLSIDDLVARVESNDPSLTNLKVCLCCPRHNIRTSLVPITNDHISWIGLLQQLAETHM